MVNAWATIATDPSERARAVSWPKKRRARWSSPSVKAATRVSGLIGEVHGLPQPRHGTVGVRAEPAGESVEECGGERVARLRGGQIGGLPADFGLGPGICREIGGFACLQQQLLRPARVSG